MSEGGGLWAGLRTQAPSSQTPLRPQVSSCKKEDALSRNTIRPHPSLPWGPSGSCLSWRRSLKGLIPWGRDTGPTNSSPSPWLHPWGLIPGTGRLATTSCVWPVLTPRGPSPTPPSLPTDAGDRCHAGPWQVSQHQALVLRGPRLEQGTGRGPGGTQCRGKRQHLVKMSSHISRWTANH